MRGGWLDIATFLHLKLIQMKLDPTHNILNKACFVITVTIRLKSISYGIILENLFIKKYVFKYMRNFLA